MTEISTRWQNYFMGLAIAASEGSKDASTKVGAIIYRPDRSTCSTGFNGLPRGIPDTVANLTDRALKYPRIVHAEANALDHRFESVKGYGIVVTAPPCSACALRIISAGIATVYYKSSPALEERWRDDIALAKQLFVEAGVKFMEIK